MKPWQQHVVAWGAGLAGGALTLVLVGPFLACTIPDPPPPPPADPYERTEEHPAIVCQPAGDLKRCTDRDHPQVVCYLLAGDAHQAGWAALGCVLIPSESP